MFRRSIRRRVSIRAAAARYGRVYRVPEKPAEETRARKDEVRACKAGAFKGGVSDVTSQEAQLQRCWRIATLLDHHDGDDDGMTSSTRNDALRRAGLPNLGNTCFINAAVQALAHPLLSSRFDLETGTLAAQAADAAFHAVQCNAKMLEALHHTLPCGFGWRNAVFKASAFDAEADDDHVRSPQKSLERAEERANQSCAVMTMAAAQPAERLALHRGFIAACCAFEHTKPRRRFCQRQLAAATTEREQC